MFASLETSLWRHRLLESQPGFSSLLLPSCGNACAVWTFDFPSQPGAPESSPAAHDSDRPAHEPQTFWPPKQLWRPSAQETGWRGNTSIVAANRSCSPTRLEAYMTPAKNNQQQIQRWIDNIAQTQCSSTFCFREWQMPRNSEFQQKMPLLAECNAALSKYLFHLVCDH